ncbi:MAG TPA: hypothetical protein VNL18_09065 [Gemmatimonadales bacterium]|nr:hypothetical protein [Gemmatimonadales bacterium]
MSGLFTYVEVIVLGAALSVVIYAAAAATLATGSAARGTAIAAIALAWFLVVWELARLGVFEGGRPGWRTALGLAVLLPVMTTVLARGALSRSATMPAPGSLVSLQAYRLVSITLLIALAGEALPAWIAVPWGLGDLAVALVAPPLGAALGRGRTGASRAHLAWSAAGVAVVVFGLAVVLITGRTAGYFLTLYPLVLIPAFLGPCSLLLHALALGTNTRSQAVGG